MTWLRGFRRGVTWTVVYDVRIDDAGEYSCSCSGFAFRGTCRHAATLAALKAQPWQRPAPAPTANGRT